MMAFAIFAGLESLAVARLKDSWNRVDTLDPKHTLRSEFEGLRETFSPASGQQQLRFYHISNVRKIVIPFMGLWTKDLFLIDRNNPTFLDWTVLQQQHLQSGVIKRMVNSDPTRSPPATLNLWTMQRAPSLPDKIDKAHSQEIEARLDESIVRAREPSGNNGDGGKGSNTTSPREQMGPHEAEIDQNCVSAPLNSMCDVGDEEQEHHCIASLEKLTMVADALSRVIFFQGNNFHAHNVRTIVDPIEHASFLLSEEALYKISLRREPRSESFGKKKRL
jgi:hypothetical protein